MAESEIDEALLKDVIIHLFDDTYTIDKKIEVLAWGERNRAIYVSLVKEFQPDYFYYDLGEPSVKTITLGRDLGLWLQNPCNK